MTVVGGLSRGLLPRVERHERHRVMLAALCFVCIAPGVLIARAAGDALFLSHFGSGPLPLMYVAGGVAAGLGTYACVWASRRLGTGSITLIVGCLLLLANLALFSSFRALPSFSRAAAYLLADVSVRIPIFLFWACASEIFDARESRRLFGVIGSAGTAACLPAGLIVGPLARMAGAESLVLVTAGLLGGFVLFAAALVRSEKSLAHRPGSLATGGVASARSLLGTPQLISIAALAVVTSLVETLVDYQFKTTAAKAATGTALADIFGTLYAAASVASLIIQLFLVHRLLAVAGVLASLYVLPAALFLSQAGVLRFRSAGWVFATKAVDLTLTTTVNGTARQLLYRGVLRPSRLTARALADGLYLPLAIGLAGAGLGIVSGSVSVAAAAAAAAVGCGVWFFLARRAHRAYIVGLLDAIRARRFGSSEEPLWTRDPSLEDWLREAFGRASDEDVVYLAAVLPQLTRLISPAQLKSALARENPKVKVAILQSLRGGGIKDGQALARSLCGHPDAEVRHAAILAATDPGSDGEDRDWLKESLEDPQPRVRAAAAAGLASASAARSRSLGWERLEDMARSLDQPIRAAAAEALEHGRNQSPAEAQTRTRILALLLRDTDVPVALAALETVKVRKSTDLASEVLSLLAQPVLAGAASDALVAMGPDVIETVSSLVRVSGRSGSDRAIAKIPTILERIGDRRGLVLMTPMRTPDSPEERSPLFRAYIRLLGPAAGDARRAEIEELAQEECRAAAARLTSIRRLGSSTPVAPVRGAVSDLLACHVQNVFTLLEARVRSVDMAILHRQVAMGAPEERAYALEILENVLPKALRRPLLNVLEPVAENGGAEPEAEVHRLLSEEHSEWVVAAAAWAAGELGLASSGERLRALTHHPSLVVQETAAFALERLGAAR